MFFQYIEFKGKVNLKNPERTFILIEDRYNNVNYFGKIIAGRTDGTSLFDYKNLITFIISLAWKKEYI